MQAGVQIKTERCNFHALEEVKLRATSLIVVTPVGLLALPPYHDDMDMPTDPLTWSQITASAFTVLTVLAELIFILAYLFAVRRLRARGGPWARNSLIVWQPGGGVVRTDNASVKTDIPQILPEV